MQKAHARILLSQLIFQEKLRIFLRHEINIVPFYVVQVNIGLLLLRLRFPGIQYAYLIRLQIELALVFRLHGMDLFLRDPLV